MLRSESVSQWVTDKHCQWSDTGPIINSEAWKTLSYPIYTLLLQISIGRKLLFFWRNFLPQNLQPLNLFWQTSSLTGTGEAASPSKEFLSGADQPLLTETTETTKLKPQELQILEKEGGNSNLSLSRILGGQGGLGWVQGGELSLNLSFIPFSYFCLTKMFYRSTWVCCGQIGCRPCANRAEEVDAGEHVRALWRAGGLRQRHRSATSEGQN